MNIYKYLLLISLIFLFSPAISKAVYPVAKRRCLPLCSLFLILPALLILLAPTKAYGATEFISVVDTGGTGDYSTLSAWQLNNHVDLTAATTLVFSYDASFGTIADGDSVSTDGGASTATLVHETATQILLSGISGSFDDNDVVTDGTNTVTLSNSGDSAISVASCQGSDADTAAVTIDGWTTSAANYIKVWTTQANRHSGVWDTGKYRLEITANSDTLTVSEAYTKVYGLQVRNTSSNNEWRYSILFTTGSDESEVGYCIVKEHASAIASNRTGIVLGSTETIYCFNNVVYDFIYSGIRAYYNGASGPQQFVYSNTVINCAVGIYHNGGWRDVSAKNNVCFDNTDDYLNSDSWSLDTSCNAYSEGTDPGSNGVDIASYAGTDLFTDYANNNFHLKSDSALVNIGTDTSGESSPLDFSTDIDSETRTNHSWDIGADEAAEKIYRSVGPSASTYLERGIDGGGNI